MNKPFLSLSAALVLLSLAGCQPKSPTVVGKWRGKSMLGMESVSGELRKQIEGGMTKMELEFKEDGTVNIAGMPASGGPAKYEVNGANVKVIPPGESATPGASTQFLTFALSPDGKTLTQSGGAMGMNLVLERL